MAVNQPLASPNDVSDIRPDAGNSGSVSPTQLPIRGEKRIIPTPINPATLSNQFDNAWTATGNQSPAQQGFDTNGRQSTVEASDFYVTAALKPFVDYVVIRIPHRGVTASQQQDGNVPAVYRFLINPNQIAVARTTIDGQAMTRAGWQIGVWGEDMFQVTLTGKTAGQYFAFGITDAYQQFTESYRNLEQLQVVFENNGYWFEGEQAAEGPLGADFARRRIKMHEDVELIVGNFMWYGMFDTLTISQSADEPWLASFSIVFTVWKERFRNSSPYDNQLPNDIQRGHSYSAWSASALSTSNGIPPNAATPPYRLLPPNIPPPVNQPLTAPAVTSAQQILPQNDPTASDYTPMANVLDRTTPTNVSFWNGSLGIIPPPPNGGN